MTNIHAKARVSRVVWGFMSSKMTRCLSQVIAGPIHLAGHTIDLIYYTAGEGILEVGGVKPYSLVMDRSLPDRDQTYCFLFPPQGCWTH